jgi:hypothetical protein
MPPDHEPTLSEECAEVESHHPGWHVRVSQHSATIQATTARHEPGGLASGTTLDAPTPALINHAIALWEHQHPQVAA